MTTVDECVRMAQEAQGDNAYVAVFMHYRSAVEEAGYSSNAAPVLLAAVQYAQGLKKGMDRTAVAAWGTKAMTMMALNPDLEGVIGKEITKLQAKGDANAASP
ncbi:hypothetical protein HYU16_00835 [Candidatus Woesearchaeota archaeon]|nr:hypothetical protein [Candidatus Woesearchaeota archaeon]